ncbi:reverse transcriptase domain-containing protein [Tanacetum coccineum]
MVSGSGTQQPVINQVTEEKIKVAIHPEYPEQTIAIGSTLIEEGQTELCGLLRRNLDVFIWKPTDMTGVQCHIAEHRLNIHKGCLPVRQKKRGQAPERNKAIYEEVEKLVNAGEHDIYYRPRTSVKGQILMDFIMEHPKDDPPNTPMEDKEELSDPWIMFTDGSSCIDGSGAGLILTNPEGVEFTYALRFRFDATNNEAKYEALIVGLRIAEQMGVKKSSSKLLVEGLKEKSIDEKEVLAVVEEEGRTWITPIHEYLTEEIIPEEKRKAKAIHRKAGRYVVTNGILYKKSFLRLWLRCVGPLQANYVLREIHEGSCSMHAGPRSVVAKALRSGYYWPTMHTDARKLIRECNSCQVHRPVTRNPQHNLTPITSPWPFYKWGINIAGPFPEGPGKVKFLIVAMDDFTKWIEVKPVATIMGVQIKKFVWDNIVCIFGLPGEIISNNGKQFRDMYPPMLCFR